MKAIPTTTQVVNFENQSYETTDVELLS